jgi:hypothetical protein
LDWMPLKWDIQNPITWIFLGIHWTGKPLLAKQESLCSNLFLFMYQRQ